MTVESLPPLNDSASPSRLTQVAARPVSSPKTQAPHLLAQGRMTSSGGCRDGGGRGAGSEGGGEATRESAHGEGEGRRTRARRDRRREPPLEGWAGAHP